MAGGGACMAGGQGNVWQGVCMTRGVYGKGGMHGREGMHGGGACVAGGDHAHTPRDTTRYSQ